MAEYNSALVDFQKRCEDISTRVVTIARLNCQIEELSRQIRMKTDTLAEEAAQLEIKRKELEDLHCEIIKNLL